VEDAFFKQYQKSDTGGTEVADGTGSLSAAYSANGAGTNTLGLAYSTGLVPTSPTKASQQVLATSSSSTRPIRRVETSAKPPSPPLPSASSPNAERIPDRPFSDIPLILYAYYETADTRPNLQFFISHALHAKAKFVFIFNGETDAQLLLPTNQSNIHYVKRNNTCFDLGAYAEVLKSNGSMLIRQHKRFIMINASLRGPFVPFWSRDCWSDAYLAKLSDHVKLVGMTMNCRSDLPRHVQSMILATDSLGLATLLRPDGIDNCPQDMSQAVAFETGLTSLIKANGYTVSVMMAMGNSYDGWVDVCANGDVTVAGAYDGTNIHPYDTMFVKTKRGTDPKTLELLTQWHDGSNYSSYNYC
jgi:hypothetical protein